MLDLHFKLRKINMFEQAKRFFNAADRVVNQELPDNTQRHIVGAVLGIVTRMAVQTWIASNVLKNNDSAYVYDMATHATTLVFLLGFLGRAALNKMRGRSYALELGAAGGSAGMSVLINQLTPMILGK